MEIIYNKDEMKGLCKDLLYLVSRLKQYTDIVVDEETINTDVQHNAINYARCDIPEIDRILYLMDTMLKNRKDENANRYEDSNNTDFTNNIGGDNN